MDGLGEVDQCACVTVVALGSKFIYLGIDPGSNRLMLLLLLPNEVMGWALSVDLLGIAAACMGLGY